MTRVRDYWIPVDKKNSPIVKVINLCFKKCKMQKCRLVRKMVSSKYINYCREGIAQKFPSKSVYVKNESEKVVPTRKCVMNEFRLPLLHRKHSEMKAVKH